MAVAASLKGVAVALSALAALAAIVVGVYWPQISRWRQLWLQGPDAWPEFATKDLDKRCSMIDTSLYGCEDAVVHGDYAYIACSSRESRTAWFPAGGTRDSKAKPAKDTFYVYDFAEKALKPMHILRMDSVPDLVLHGISVIDGDKPNKVVLAAVNHRRTGSCVELFDHRVGTDELIHFASTCSPTLYSPNGVALISRTEFYATNWLSKDAIAGHAWAQAKDAALARPTSSIVFRSTDGNVRIVKEGLAGANGIALMPNLRTLVVAETMSGELSFFDIQADKSLRTAEQKLSLPFMPDNVRTIPKTGHITVAGPAQAYAFARAKEYHFTYGRAGKGGAAGGGKKGKKSDGAGDALGPPVPSVLARVANATVGEARFLGQKYSVDPVIVDAHGYTLYSASVAAVHWPSKVALVGGPYMRGLAQCAWPETIPALTSKAASGGSGGNGGNGGNRT